MIISLTARLARQHPTQVITEIISLHTLNNGGKPRLLQGQTQSFLKEYYW